MLLGYPQNPEVSDTTGDAISTNAGNIKKVAPILNPNNIQWQSGVFTLVLPHLKLTYEANSNGGSQNAVSKDKDRN
jgi:hypothetical protein